MTRWNTHARKAGASLAGLAICAALTAGCASAPTRTHPIAGGSAPPAGSPQAQAERQASALVDAFASIPGARVSSAPQGTTERAESWTVDGSAASVYASARARLPHWPAADARPGRMGDDGYSETVETTGTGTLAEQSVNIMVLPSTEGGGSELRVNADVAYRNPRPASDRIPDSRVLTATLAPSPDPEGAAGGGITVGAGGEKILTSAPRIARIAAELDALPTAPVFVDLPCPAFGTPSTLTLDFAPTAHAPASDATVVVITTLPTGVCGPGIDVTVDGAAQPSLDNAAGSGLFALLEKQTGFIS